MLAEHPGMIGSTSSAFEAIPALRVAEVMHRGVVSCPAEESLETVAALMSAEQIHCVIVVHDGDSGSLWGVVSDLDLVAAATVRSLDEQGAGGTAMKPAVTALPHETLEQAARRMTEHGVSHLVVIDMLRRRPLGVLSTLDLASAWACAVTSGGFPSA